MPITNQQVAGHAFLRQMYDNSYFPDHVVDQGKAILLRLCERIEAERPSDLESLYALTQAATEEFNLLDGEFVAAGSEIETVSLFHPVLEGEMGWSAGAVTRQDPSSLAW
ncbi:DUF5713 family protein [Streptomyces hydrogenans]|uniref:DUF5713 family protein n=1 Tax=Streptomyces hydrogenans TaxID=1873719 RepID=UPI0035D6363B